MVIPGGKLQAPVASRTCWANWQGVLLVDPVVTPLPPVVVVVGAFGAQEFPFQNVFMPQPPGGGVGAVGAMVGAFGAHEFPFQNVFIGQPPGGGLGAVGVVGVVVVVAAGTVDGGGSVGLGPPLFSQEI